ncbi:MAG: carbohydrate ABC transporter permease [Chloroflexi bacterium]|nr:carbohydrate ABC transporter permease [Chloroflexota bacterium]MDL1884761.1 carbohydrate ABC transporter permease [Anaerolineae bacterium CFX8]
MRIKTVNTAAKPSILPRNLSTHIILSLFLLAAVMPLIGTLLTSFKDPTDLAASPFALPREWHFENYEKAWSQARFGDYFVNSIVVVVAVVGISVFLTVLSGYAMGLLKFRGKALINIMILVGLMVPFEAVIIPLWGLMRDLKLYNTIWSLILPQVALSFSFGTFWMQAYFKGVPGDIVDAAVIDGCTSWSMLWRVLFPMAQPSILSMVVLLFIWTWNEFLLVLVMIQKDSLRTLPVGLASLQGRFSTDLSLVAAATVIVTVPTLIVYFIFQRQFISGMISGALRG